MVTQAKEMKSCNPSVEAAARDLEKLLCGFRKSATRVLENCHASFHKNPRIAK
jgi:hypothetical protein